MYMIDETGEKSVINAYDKKNFDADNYEDDEILVKTDTLYIDDEDVDAEFEDLTYVDENDILRSFESENDIDEEE